MSSTILQDRIRSIFNTRLNVILSSQRLNETTSEPQDECGAFTEQAAEEPAYEIPKHARDSETHGQIGWVCNLLGEHARQTALCEKHVIIELSKRTGTDELLSAAGGPVISTYMGWIKRDRQVRKGEKGVKVGSSFLRLLAMISDAQGRSDEATELRSVACTHKTFSVFFDIQTSEKSGHRRGLR